MSRPTRSRPTQPESDGTAEWDATTMVLVHAHAGGEAGLGYTYGNLASGTVVESTLAADVVVGRDAMSVTACLGRDGPSLPQPGPARESRRWRSARSTRRSGI